VVVTSFISITATLPVLDLVPQRKSTPVDEYPDGRTALRFTAVTKKYVVPFGEELPLEAGSVKLVCIRLPKVIYPPSGDGPLVYVGIFYS
jgi:hypothetical protein